MDSQKRKLDDDEDMQDSTNLTVGNPTRHIARAMARPTKQQVPRAQNNGFVHRVTQPSMDTSQLGGHPDSFEAMIAQQQQAAHREVAVATSQVKIAQIRESDQSWDWRLANLTEEQLERELERAAELKRFQEQNGFSQQVTDNNNDMDM
eukprot:m.109135 g.109135  ORF g.109135 m.109135 type:complete len:149 (-) comp27931_c0_seq2:78-524(-)